MEYIFTNLPQYIRVTSRTEFSSSVVHSGSVLLFSEDGASLTAKLPDGSFITVGGSGTDVSSTTAEAADVLSSKLFYNSGGTLTTGTIPTVSASITSGAVVIPSGYIPTSQSFPVSGGVDVSSTTAEAGDVLSGKVFYNSGGVMTSGTIQTVSASVSGGSVIVPSGYIATSQSFPVSSGVDVSSTTAEASDVRSGKIFYTSGGIMTSGTLNLTGWTGGSTITPGFFDIPIFSGTYFTNLTTIKGDINLQSWSIVSGCSIFGVGGYPWNVPVSDTTVEAADVLSGKIFYNSGGTLTTGTIPTVSASITSGAVVIPSGYIPTSQSFPVSSGGGSMTIYKAASVSGPYTETYYAVSSAGMAAVNGNYSDTGTTKDGHPVYSYTSGGTTYYLFYDSGLEAWFIHTSTSFSDYAMDECLYYKSDYEESWTTGGAGSGDPPTVTLTTVTHDLPKTWTGRQWNTSSWEFDSAIVSSGLSWTGMKPVVGGIYDAACVYRIGEIAGYVDGRVIYFPFTSNTDTTMGPSATLVSGTYTQATLQGITCLNADSVNLQLAYTLQMPLSVCFWAKPSSTGIKISLGDVDDTEGNFVWVVSDSLIQTFKHAVSMYISRSIDNSGSIAFYCVTLSSTGNTIWKNGLQLDSYTGNYGSFPGNLIDMKLDGYITNLSVIAKVLSASEIETLYNELHPTAP